MARILVVEPENAVSDELASAMSLGAHAVSAVRSGREALAWAEKHGSPDVVVLDLELPDMRPRVVLTALRARGRRHLPAMFLSRRPRKSLRFGESPVLIAPFRPTEARAVLDEVFLESGR
ncbi:MAG TPA: response regulator [Actinomycetota bacterium]|nr:response regulator [Actinomycetota bacterium]